MILALALKMKEVVLCQVLVVDLTVFLMQVEHGLLEFIMVDFVKHLPVQILLILIQIVMDV